MSVSVTAIDSEILNAIRDASDLYKDLSPRQIDYIKRDPRDPEGNGVLHLLRRYNIQSNKVSTLVELGLDPLARNRLGHLPIDSAIMQDPESYGNGFVREFLMLMKSIPGYTDEAKLKDLNNTYRIAGAMNNNGVRHALADAMAPLLLSKKNNDADEANVERKVTHLTGVHRNPSQVRQVRSRRKLVA